ncbi:MULTISPECIES: hypothetical protein [unclassified Sphingobium]|uniref:hypothetical protein n=1 Tax=unclassified Sphingobium TaxID=2611147 RepID=UPI000D153D1F|nr:MULTISPECIES: hypothetical protein [unclassified Sphingobium]MBG6118682.1 hypothetical protein [Sphingobium sp. JAI105]PSO13642.1 hypothetical protein C7E20_01035 [Sphingobium sp. AEW4]TWD10639.1 hypothetical protein FB595_103206 [Sphingobium sp. AEW010]TWD27956.1 hypothetical protein FB596_103109 [Sphingobium sp. AEW013]TWD28973.1 hypothetical protein FB594_103206 [Sphingobium sp. AEW001]
MGYHRSFLFAAPLLLALPVHAQQAEDAAPVFTLPPTSAPQPANPNRQGPELDVFRAPATTAAPPPVVAPTITPTPAPAPQVPAQRAAPPPARPSRATPEQTAPRAAAERATPEAESRSAATPAPERTQDPAPESTPAPQPAPTPAASAPEEAPPPPANANTTPWPWIIGGALLLLALAAFILLHRRRPTAPDAAEVEIATPAPVPAPAPPKAAPAPKPAPTPERAPEPTPAAATPDAPDRPWLDMALDLSLARYSLVGMTVGYTLLLHNRGDTPAQDVLVRGIIGNAGAEQQALLQSFFAQQSGLPLHSAMAIVPGETRRLTGELRLMPDEIVPVTMGQRSLLIPLAAFDASYHWGPDGGEPQGHGRTARAFILGQEQEPPADRLAPFRLDQGPRQYRRPATRAAGELVPS